MYASQQNYLARDVFIFEPIQQAEQGGKVIYCMSVLLIDTFTISPSLNIYIYI